MERERDRIRILLADGQHLVRQGIRQLLEREADLEVIGEADNGLETVRLACELKPDIVIMEASMPRLDSIEVTRRVKAEHPKGKVLILTSSEEEEYIVGLVAADASGYLLKSTHGDELVHAIHSVCAGGFVCEPAIAQKLFKRTARLPIIVNSVEHPTHRELDVLKLAAKGLSNQSIADKPRIGSRTVRQNLMNIYGKMGVRSRTEAVSKALRQHWLDLD